MNAVANWDKQRVAVYLGFIGAGLHLALWLTHGFTRTGFDVLNNGAFLIQMAALFLFFQKPMRGEPTTNRAYAPLFWSSIILSAAIAFGMARSVGVIF